MEWARFRWIIRRTDILSNLKPNLPKNLEEISSTIPHPEGITLDDKDNIFVSSASTGNIFLVSKNDIKVHANTKGRPLGIAYSKKLNEVVMMRDAKDHTKDDFVLLSGTKVREMLAAGQELPPEFARKEVAEILMMKLLLLV